MEQTLAEIRDFYRSEAMRAEITSAVIDSLTADSQPFLAQQIDKAKAVSNIVTAATPIAN